MKYFKNLKLILFKFIAKATFVILSFFYLLYILF